MILRRASLSIILGTVLLTAAQIVRAQDPPSAEQQQKAQAALKEKAFQLLDQVIEEAQALKLAENRVRLQWQAGDLLWERDEVRARTLFSQAAAGVGEMIQSLDTNDRRYIELLQTPVQLRQELLMTVTRRDPKLAYNFLLATRPPAPANASNIGQQNAESNLEMNLLAQIASSDPRLALQSAESALDKGQFPSSLARLLAQLQEKDKDAAAKLKEKLLKRLRTEPLLSNSSAISLALGLLRSGPRLPETQTSSQQASAIANNPNQAIYRPLDEAAFRELLEIVVAAALTAVVRPPGQPIGPPVAGPFIPGGGQASAQAMQNNARMLINGLQALLPQIDKYLPARSQAARQKLTEIGADPNRVVIDSELSSLLRQGSTEALLQAASKTQAPGTREMLYRQAASKAMNEGNLERARQIATDHLDQRQRDSVFQELERQQAIQNVLAGKMEEARRTLAGMKTDAERVNLLTQVAATAVKKNNQKLALQFLEEARALASRRAENYQQFELQLRVARGYAEVDSSRAVEMLAPGIEQLNELLAAAVILSGFELRVFKEGEMLLQGGGQLSSMVMRYGQALSAIANLDFERANTAADRFLRPDSRIVARLAIVRGLLGARAEYEMPLTIMAPAVSPPPSPIR